jgi:hypothetical protein
LLSQRLAALVAAPSVHYNHHFIVDFALRFRDAVFAFLKGLTEVQLRDTTTEALAVCVRMCACWCRSILQYVSL